jgi:hypothetical protein
LRTVLGPLGATALACSAGCFDFSDLTECRGGTAYVCEDFESSEPSDDAWMFYENGTTSGTIGSDRAHGSGHAVHIVSSLQQNDAWAVRWDGLDQQQPHVFIRAFVFVPAPPAGKVTLYNLIEDVTPFEGVRIWIEDTGKLTIHNGVEQGDATTTDPLTQGRWTCVEWEVDSSNSGAMKLWVDDELVAETTGDTLPATKLGKINIGVITQSLLTPFELWLDDVIVDDERITCVQ